MAKRGIPTPSMSMDFATWAQLRADRYRKSVAARSRYMPTGEENPYFVDARGALIVATLAGPVPLALYDDLPSEVAG